MMENPKNIFMFTKINSAQQGFGGLGIIKNIMKLYNFSRWYQQKIFPQYKNLSKSWY